MCGGDLEERGNDGETRETEEEEQRRRQNRVMEEGDMGGEYGGKEETGRDMGKRKQ